MKRKNRREELAARHFADYYGGNSSDSSVEGLYILGELETSSDDEHQHDKVVIVDNIDEDDQALQDDYYYFSLEEEEEKEPVRKSRKINKLDEDDELYYPSSEELSDFDDEQEEMEQEIDEEQYNNNINFNDNDSLMFDNEEVLNDSNNNSTVNIQQTNLVSEVVGTITRGKSKELCKQSNKKTKPTRITNKTSENLTNSNILSISNDILIDEIFKFLTFNCTFSKASLVCKQWYKATLEPPSVNCEYVLSLDYDYLFDTYSSETKFKKALLKSRKRFKNIQGFSIPELVLERDHICNCIFENYELFDHLKILRFEDSYIGFDYSKLANVGTLEELSFINTKLTSKGMQEICGGKLTNLKKLILNNCEGTVEHLPHANFINLEYLSIHSNIGKSLTLNIVSWFTKLTYLDLQMMTKITDETLKAISNLSLLKHLSIEYSTISQLFPFENELKNLTSLSFGNSELFENFLPNLYKANLQSLTRLNLAFITPSITEEDVQPLLNMNLKTMILSDNLKNMENYYSISKRNVYCSNFLSVEYIYRRKPEQTQPQEESTYPNIESSQMNESYEQLEHFTTSEHIQEDIIDEHLDEELQQALLKEKNQQKSKKKTHTNTQKRTKKKTKPNNEDRCEEYVFSDEEDEEYCSTSRSIITRSKTRKKLKDHPEVEIIHEQEIDEDLDEELQQALLKDIKKNQQKSTRKTRAKTQKRTKKKRKSKNEDWFNNEEYVFSDEEEYRAIIAGSKTSQLEDHSEDEIMQDSEELEHLTASKKKTTKALKKKNRFYSGEETSSEDFEDRVIMTRSRTSRSKLNITSNNSKEHSDDSDSLGGEDKSNSGNQLHRANILSISDDILINEIFTYFDFGTVYTKFSLVCRSWLAASLEIPVNNKYIFKLNYFYLQELYQNQRRFLRILNRASVRFKNIGGLEIYYLERFKDDLYCNDILKNYSLFENLNILKLEEVTDVDYCLIANIPIYHGSNNQY